MNKAFSKKYFLQFTASLMEVVSLAFFVVILPRLSNDSVVWLANYFLYSAIINLIFLFFSFESRKRTVNSLDRAALESANRARTAGIMLSLLLSLLAPFFLTGFLDQPDYKLFYGLVFFCVVRDFADQSASNFEWMQMFVQSLISAMLRTSAFVIVATLSILIFRFDVGLGVLLGAIASFLVMFAYNIKYSAISILWLSVSLKSVRKRDLVAGLGSFSIGLSLHGPRLVANTFGAAELVLLGVGQSINKIGQLLVSSLVQTYLATRKNKSVVSPGGVSVIIVLMLFVLMLMILLMPLWEILFPDIKLTMMYSTKLFLVLLFGSLSMANYSVQSLVLVDKGENKFLKSALIFLFGMSVLLIVVQIFSTVDFVSLMVSMIAIRIVQIVHNIRVLLC